MSEFNSQCLSHSPLFQVETISRAIQFATFKTVCRYAFVAQLDRAQVSGTWCQGFESLRARHFITLYYELSSNISS